MTRYNAVATKRKYKSSGSSSGRGNPYSKLAKYGAKIAVSKYKSYTSNRSKPTPTKTAKPKKKDAAYRPLKPTQTGTGTYKSTVKFGKFREVPKSIKDENELNQYIAQTSERIVTGPGRQQNGGFAGNLFTPGETANFITQGTTNNPRHSYIKSAVLRTYASNTTNTNIKVTIYQVKPKRDMDGDNTAGANNDPLQDWGAGYANQGATSVAAQYVDATPYDVSRFGSLWTVWKTTVYYLSQGESFCHSLYLNVNKRMSHEVLNRADDNTTSATDRGAIKGLTQYQMISIKGFPEHDHNTRTNITTEPAGLDIVYTKKYTTCNMTTVARTENVGPLLLTSLTTPEQVNIATGTETTAAS